MKFSLGLAAASALFLPVLVNAGGHGDSKEIFVQVAPGGKLVFEPSNISAKNGTTVTCIFADTTVHSATQGSFDNPCVPLAGGFDSGLESAGGNNFSVTIKNDQVPITFFSKARDDCAKGMIATVNAGTSKPSAPGTSKPPSTSAFKPPTTSASKPPTTSASKPPTTSASMPPTTSASKPPTTSASKPPTTSASMPPTTSASKPPTTSPSKPPTTSPTKASESPTTTQKY